MVSEFHEPVVASYCSIEDIKHIPSIDIASYGEAFYNYIVARQLWDIHRNHFFVIRKGLMSVRGYALGAIDPDGIGWLLSVAVYPNNQNNGYGTILTHQVIRSLFRSEVDAIKLTVSPENDRAHSLYKGIGFENVGSHPDPKYFGNTFGSRFVLKLDREKYQHENDGLQGMLDAPLPFPVPI